MNNEYRVIKHLVYWICILLVVGTSIDVPTTSVIAQSYGKIYFSILWDEEHQANFVINANGDSLEQIKTWPIAPLKLIIPDNLKLVGEDLYKVSPDKQNIAYIASIVEQGKNSDHIYVAQEDGTNPRQITMSASRCIRRLSWLPQKTAIIFLVSNATTSDCKGNLTETTSWRLHSIEIQSGREQELFHEDWITYSLSPNGETLFAVIPLTSKSDSPVDLFAIGLKEGGRKHLASMLFDGAFGYASSNLDWSHSGKYVAFVGRDDMFTRDIKEYTTGVFAIDVENGAKFYFDWHYPYIPMEYKWSPTTDSLAVAFYWQRTDIFVGDLSNIYSNIQINYIPLENITQQYDGFWLSLPDGNEAGEITDMVWLP